jgi:DNA-binding IclR family transcriptional regulator
MRPPLADRVLHLLHNLAAVNPDNAKSLADLARLAQEPAETIQTLLREEETSGHVKSLKDDNTLRYYLTGLGILRAASMLT